MVYRNVNKSKAKLIVFNVSAKSLGPLSMYNSKKKRFCARLLLTLSASTEMRKAEVSSCFIGHVLDDRLSWGS